jgi:hypothetical protein
VAGPWCPQQNAASRFLHLNGQEIMQKFIRLAVHRIRMSGGDSPKGFKEHLERVFVGHGYFR